MTSELVELRLLASLEHAPFATYCLRGQTIVWCNGAMARLVGAANPAEVIGRDALTFAFPEQHEDLARRLKDLHRGFFNSPLRMNVKRLDGLVAEAEVQPFPLGVETSDAFAFIAIDTTARRSTEEQYRSLVDSAPYGILLTKFDWKIHFANPALRRLLGYDDERLDDLGDIRNLVHPDDIPSVLARRAAFSSGGDPGATTMRLRHKDGTYSHCEVQTEVIRVGRDTALRSFVRDVTDARLAEEALRASESQYRDLLNASPDAIAVTQQGEFVLANPAYLDLMGATSVDQLKGRPRQDRVPVEYRDVVEERMRAVHAGLSAPLMEQRAVRLDGAVIDIEAQSAPIVYEQKPAVLSVLRDITARKSKERALHDSERRYRQLVELLPDPVFVIDGGLLVYANPGTRRLLELAPNLAQNPLDFVAMAPEGDRDRLKTLIETVTLHRRAASGEIRLRQTSGVVHLEVRAAAIELEGRPAALVVARDLSQRRRAEQLQSALYRIAQASTRATSLDTLLPELHEIVGELMYAKNFFIGLINASEDVLEFPYYRDEKRPEAPAQLPIKNTVSAYVIDSGEPLLADRAVIEHFLAAQKAPAYGVIPESWIGVPLVRGARTFGVLVVQSYDLNTRYTPADRDLLTFVSGHLAEAIERKQKDEEIHGLAYRDSLTALPNRFLFEDRLRVALSLAERSRASLAVLFIDLDRFKDINDSFGHSVGDGVLRVVAERFRTCLRESDTIARRGGDEFLAMLPDTDQDGATLVASKLIESLRAPIEAAGIELTLSTSIGIAVFPENGRDLGSLLKAADIAMYRAKDSGRDGHQLFSTELNADIERRINIERGLRTAIVRRKLTLNFQPIVDARTSRPVAAEALVRWNDEDGRSIEPTTFIGIAESSGLIVPLGDLVLREALQQARGWAKVDGQQLRVTVNVSARQLTHPAFEEDLARVLDAERFPADSLTIEITESAALQESAVVERLQRIRASGVDIAIDDFGVGYSSLSRLKSLPVGTLKVDASFVRGMTEDRGAVADAIVLLGRALDLRVVAEGVETEGQKERLLQAGCHLMQGFHFERPMTNEALREWLKKF